MNSSATLREYDRAIEQCRAVLEMDPNFNRARGILVHAYTQSGRFVDAMHQIETLKRQPDATWAWAWKAYVYGRWGRRSDAEHALLKFEHLSPRYPYDPTQTLLFGYVGIGHVDRVITTLQKASVEHSHVLSAIKVDPGYDPLRSDPRFQQLLARTFQNSN